MDSDFFNLLESFDFSNMTTEQLNITPGQVKVNCPELLEHYNTSILPNESFKDEEFQRQLRNLQLLRHYLYDMVIPVVCVFGFFGNILNVAVFSKKRTRRTLDEIEYCTTICLVALAVSDMMFCFCTFPNTFLKKDEEPLYHKAEFMLYYKICASFLINSFIMSSTLLTVLTAIMRYTAICHPFHTRQFISLKKTIIAILFLYFFSFAFNFPYLWLYVMKKDECIGNTYVQLSKGEIFQNNSFVSTHKLLWAVLGNFVPLSILLYCNIRLVRALHQSQKLRLLHSRDNVGCLSAHKRINITLITIIILFFILVAPSEITKFILYVSEQSQNNSYTYHMVAMVTNTLQCINFSVNFILYYVIIAPFRKTIHEFICVLKFGRSYNHDSSNSQKQQTCVLLTIKDQRRNLL